MKTLDNLVSQGIGLSEAIIRLPFLRAQTLSRLTLSLRHPVTSKIFSAVSVAASARQSESRSAMCASEVQSWDAVQVHQRAEVLEGGLAPLDYCRHN